jgi:ribose transport system ATP-binding protein
VNLSSLRTHGIEKSYGPTRALTGVDLEAEGGQITAVIGQNGAGKSTLMGVLAGTVAPDAGTMTLDEAPYAPQSPLGARRAGVAMVHQELSLCPHLSVAENVLLGRLPARSGFVDWKGARKRVEAALEPLAVIDPRAKVGDLSLANQQLVEIARALAFQCRVLILDEPTSSLAASDVARLFARLRELRGRGLVILYLSHFLEEVTTIADRFVVLRDGKNVGGGDVTSASVDQMVELMAGRAIATLYPRSKHAPGDIVLTTSGLVVRRGEVVGIAGLVGAGRTTFLRSVLRDKAGKLAPPIRKAMLSEDRKAEGLAMSLSIAANITLSRPPSRWGFFVTTRSDERAARPWMERMGIRAQSAAQKVSELSGGNQQKVALARIIHDGADVLLVDEPMRGVDVETKARIYELIDQAALDGKAVLIVSSYLPELLGICDRIHVMRRGELGPSHEASAVDEHALLREAAL